MKLLEVSTHLTGTIVQCTDFVHRWLVVPKTVRGGQSCGKRNDQGMADKISYLYMLVLFMIANLVVPEHAYAAEWLEPNGHLEQCEIFNSYKFDNCKVEWTGGCSGGKADGYGVLIVFIDNKEFVRCECSLSLGKPIGSGRAVFPDGDMYVGSFVDGKMEGKGYIVTKDGHVYEVDFKKGYPKSFAFDQRILEEFKKKLGQPDPGPSQIYISYLTFMDGTTKKSMTPTAGGALIDKAVPEGISDAMKSNTKLKFNEPGHAIKDTDKNHLDLVNIVYDPNLDKDTKMNKIISDLMKPNGVDVIVTGQYVDNGAKIDVRPMLLVRLNKKISTKSLQYMKKDFLCKTQNQSVEALCQNANEEIMKAVKELLDAL
ncbi:MAG: hypothetical protein HQL80_03990 [Magnetococcales bacterium]|nr:hypothetical protein [Magnetococcales bacterium]